MKRIEQADCDPSRSTGSGETSEPIQAPGSAAALQQLILQHDNPARLLECYYWSKEPGLLECVRALLRAPDDVRTVLQVFFSAAVPRESISTLIDADGKLSLYSPEAAAILIRFFRDSSDIMPKHPC